MNARSESNNDLAHKPCRFGEVLDKYSGLPPKPKPAKNRNLILRTDPFMGWAKRKGKQ